MVKGVTISDFFKKQYNVLMVVSQLCLWIIPEVNNLLNSAIGANDVLVIGVFEV